LGREDNSGEGEWLGLVGAGDDDGLMEDVRRDVKRGV